MPQSVFYNKEIGCDIMSYKEFLEQRELLKTFQAYTLNNKSRSYNNCEAINFDSNKIDNGVKTCLKSVRAYIATKEEGPELELLHKFGTDYNYLIKEKFNNVKKLCQNSQVDESDELVELLRTIHYMGMMRSLEILYAEQKSEYELLNQFRKYLNGESKFTQCIPFIYEKYCVTPNDLQIEFNIEKYELQHYLNDKKVHELLFVFEKQKQTYIKMTPKGKKLISIIRRENLKNANCAYFITDIQEKEEKMLDSIYKSLKSSEPIYNWENYFNNGEIYKSKILSSKYNNIMKEINSTKLSKKLIQTATEQIVCNYNNFAKKQLSAKQNNEEWRYSSDDIEKIYYQGFDRRTEESSH